MKIGIVLGTRPEIIKLSPIIRELGELKNNSTKDIDYFLIHTNQHYSKYLDEIFFKELNLPKPKYNLNVGSASQGKQTGKMLEGVEEVLINERPEMVIVQGDTNSTLAGALASSKLKIKVVHIEAGLRSYDRSMPEEINRVLTDHISDYLFPPTENAKENLIREGIKKNIFVVGNTIVDATLQNIKIVESKKEIIEDILKVIPENKEYFLLTLHRAENTDNKERLNNIINGILKISEYYNIPIIFPIHPRTLKKLREYNLLNKLGSDKNIKIIEPTGYFKFLILEKNAKLIITDSGGVQEEACILKTPCITLRENTERPETLEVGSNMLVKVEDVESIIGAVDSMMNRSRDWINPFGDGNSGETIVNILLEKYKN